MKVEQEVDQRAAGEPEPVEECTTALRQDAPSISQGTTMDTSNVAGTEKSGYDELPKEMHEMKIRDENVDNHEANLKVKALVTLTI